MVLNTGNSSASAGPEESFAAAVEPPDLKMKGVEEFVRADMFDLTNMDIQLEEQHAAKVFGKRGGGGELVGKMETWEIDLSRLQKGRRVARGAHGVLYRADYDGQDVAVKVLDWGQGDDGQLTDRDIDHFRDSLREVLAVWNELDHPNVTRFVGASMGTANLAMPPSRSGEAGASPPPPRACCVVVEYLTGGTLKDHLIKHIRRKLPYKEVVRFALDMARGLSYLHAHNVVHRDVKTENMLLDGELNLKIADFGVARIEAADPREMTGTTGTLGYMAPEVLSGKPYNRKCDVYSLGICLWEMYCCDMPFADLTFTDFTSNKAGGDHGLRPEIPSCCPRAMADIMRRCWNGNPAARPDMQEVVQLLEQLDTSKGGGMVPEPEEARPGCFCVFSRRRRGR